MSTLETANGAYPKMLNAEFVHNMQTRRKYEYPTPQDAYDSAQFALAYVAQAYQGLYPADLILHLLGDPKTPNQVSVAVRTSLPL